MNFEELSPEVQRAQRMAELEQIAAYRRLKLQQYQKWSAMTPEEREHYDYDPMGLGLRLKPKSSLKEEEAAARELVAQHAEEYAKLYDDRWVNPDLEMIPFTVKEIIKPVITPPRKWWQFWRK